MGCFCYYTYKYDSRTLASRTVYETCSLMYFNVKSVTGGTLVKVFIGLVYNFTDWLTPVELANSFFLQQYRCIFIPGVQMEWGKTQRISLADGADWENSVTASEKGGSASLNKTTKIYH